MSNTYLAGEQTKYRILKESRKLFFKNGFTETTYDDICNTAKINRALIPYHFKNKQILGQEIYHKIIHDFNSTFDEILETSQFTPDFSSVLHTVAYYRLLADSRFSRFVFQLQADANSTLFTVDSEKTFITGLGNKISQLSDKELSIIIRMHIGMKKELIKMIYQSKNNTDIDQISKLNLQLLMRYAGYSRKKTDELVDAAIEVVNLFSFQIKGDFSIKINYN